MSADFSGRNGGPTASIVADSFGPDDDPRVASVLAAYLAELEAGRQPSREQLLECHADIAAALADCLDVVEFVHSASRPVRSSAQPSISKDALPAGTMLGEYRLIREIGRGATGIVYEAEQVKLARHVALKVLSGAAALDPLNLQRFQIETLALAQLHHPHIVPIFSVDCDQGVYHYAMQYIDGTTLAEVIHQKGSFGRGEGQEDCAFRAMARLAVQAAEALEHAHAMGILHRDIKPSNLLVDATGNLWVTDFGLARFQDEPGLTRTGDLLGTLRYMAPELVLGQRTIYDPRTDVYSLGATLYELLALRPVFDGRDRPTLLRQIGQEEPVAPRRINPAIPLDLETIVLKAMDKEPDCRYAAAQALALDLRRFLDDKPIRARRRTPAERAARWARRHRPVLLVGATVAFLALGIVTPLLWLEQRNTARMYQDLRLAFDQADRGFEQMTGLSDALTVSGMARYSEPGASPEALATRAAFFQQAIEFYDRLAREPRLAKPVKALAYRRLGLARMVGTHDPLAHGDLDRSLALYEELLASSPMDPELRFAISDVVNNLGLILLTTRGIAAAEPSLHRAISIDEGLAADFPDYSGYLVQLTNRRLQIADWMDSARLVVQAEQERRQLFAFYEKLASTANGLPGRARIMADSYAHLSRALGDRGRLGEQQEALRRGLRLQPGSAALLNDLAWSLSLRPDPAPRESAEAIELAKQATASNPKEPAFWNTLGLAHLRGGKLTLAAEAVQKSIELQSQGGNAPDRLLMAMLCWRRGDKPAALDWYIRALDWLSRQPESDPSVLVLRGEVERLLGRSTGTKSN
jgi:tetratricopeptide (TPR) repeat protein